MLGAEGAWQVDPPRKYVSKRRPLRFLRKILPQTTEQARTQGESRGYEDPPQ